MGILIYLNQHIFRTKLPEYNDYFFYKKSNIAWSIVFLKKKKKREKGTPKQCPPIVIESMTIEV